MRCMLTINSNISLYLREHQLSTIYNINYIHIPNVAHAHMVSIHYVLWLYIIHTFTMCACLGITNELHIQIFVSHLSCFTFNNNILAAVVWTSIEMRIAMKPRVKNKWREWVRETEREVVERPPRRQTWIKDCKRVNERAEAMQASDYGTT